MSNQTTASSKSVEAKRVMKMYKKSRIKFDDIVAADLDIFKNRPDFSPTYTNDWTHLLAFECCDAAKPLERYEDNCGRPISHIYSYNKVMSRKDRAGIAKTLNKTNYKILAWYFDPKETARCGLRDVKLLGKMSMQSTGDEAFTVYVYFRTHFYAPGVEQLWSDSESEQDQSSEQSK